MNITQEQIDYIEQQLGWELGFVGIERAEQMLELGFTQYEVVEALILL